MSSIESHLEIEKDHNIVEAVTQMSNSRILSKLAEGDMIAREACYKCITAYSN